MLQSGVVSVLNVAPMNLVASSKTAVASTLANAGPLFSGPLFSGPLFSGLAIALLAIFLGGSFQSRAAASVQATRCLLEIDESISRDQTEAPKTAVRYDSELTGFAVIDAPGRQTPSARVIKNHRCTGKSIPDDDVSSGLPRDLLNRKSPPSIADSRPSLQDFEIRLQI